MKSSFFLEKIEGTTDVDHSFLFKTSDHTLFMMLNSEIVHMYLALDLRPWKPISLSVVHTCLGQIRECPAYPGMDAIL